MKDIYREEDLFPREITSYEEREYGYLFFDELNKDSYDANHALIYKDRVSNLETVLNDIISFYTQKKIQPSIYQSIIDDGYFGNSKDVLVKKGFECWEESQKYMVLTEQNFIISDPEIFVQRVCEWDDIYATEIFEKAGEPWEVDVTRKALRNTNTMFFVAYFQEKPVGMTRCHISNNVCRVDYLLVSKEHRNKGVGRALIYYFVEYCKAHKIDKCYLWPDGETAEKIYYEAGFRIVETKKAGRAVYKI